MSTLGRQQLGPSRINAARRRATILGILTLLLASTLILGIFGIAPIWLAFIAAGLLLLYFAGALLTAPQRTARPVREVTEDVVVEEVVEVAPVARPEVHRRRKPRIASLADDEEFLNWNAWDEDTGWEAIPQTLPTYVNAPRASSVPRPIDNAHDGDWSGSAMVRAAQAARLPVSDDEIIDHRTATAEIPVVQRPAVNE
jgi:hypothetical protein